ncbi:MAG: KamA family radical SAM protein, partial [bacterium]|nr:KamA family radical SAM protein [bacterium]
MEEWKKQLANFVDTLDELKKYINVTPDEVKAITTLNTKWGMTPY